MATRVWESRVLNSPIARVWELVRPLDFKYLDKVASMSLEEKASPSEVGAVRTVTYKDGTTQRIKLLELSDATHAIAWELIASTPAVSFLSAIHSIRLRRVSEGNGTFVEWTTDFSKDAALDVTQDAKYKQTENFAALAKALGVDDDEKDWIPLESDPELMNKYIWQLGVDAAKWQFHEVHGTDDDLLGMVPQPVLAVLLLFPLTDTYEKTAAEEQARIESKGQSVSKSVYFLKQTVANACGTIGLVHSVLNNAHKLQLDAKKFFAKFLAETRNMTPQARAKALEVNRDIEVEHEAVAAEGSSDADAKCNENLHFIAFIRDKTDGHLYELDGCKIAPINHGPTGEGPELLRSAARVIRKFVAVAEGDVRFNIMALGPTAAD